MSGEEIVDVMIKLLKLFFNLYFYFKDDRFPKEIDKAEKIDEINNEQKSLSSP